MLRLLLLIEVTAAVLTGVTGLGVIGYYSGRVHHQGIKADILLPYISAILVIVAIRSYCLLLEHIIAFARGQCPILVTNMPQIAMIQLLLLRGNLLMLKIVVMVILPGATDKCRKLTGDHLAESVGLAGRSHLA